MTALRSPILRKLGEGGTAVVYESIVEGRRVAIKRRCTGVSGREQLAELLEEARLLAASKHPNVVAVVNVVVDEAGPALVMEVVDGESLAELTIDGRGVRAVNEDVVRAVALQAAAGLAAIHDARDEAGSLGLVHGDVAPKNLLVTRWGIVKVIDLGLAVCTRGRFACVDPSDVIRGTLGYVAPEQIDGVPVDARADVFSLGVILWELLAGRRLFRRAGRTETVVAVDRCEVADLATHRPDLSQGLSSLVMRMLSRDRERRPRSMREVIGALALAPLDEPPSCTLREWRREVCVAHDGASSAVFTATGTSTTERMPQRLGDLVSTLHELPSTE